MRTRQPDPWYPFWIDKWLFGSTRLELLPDERGVLVDLLTISKKDSGYIRANEGVPYLPTQLCGLLIITEELLDRTIEKCIKYKKIERLPDGTLYFLSHDTYELSDRHRRRVEALMAGNPAMASSEPAILGSKAALEENRIEENRGEESAPPLPTSTPPIPPPHKVLGPAPPDGRLSGGEGQGERPLP